MIKTVFLFLCVLILSGICYCLNRGRQSSITDNLEVLAESESPHIRVTVCYENGVTGNLSVKRECPLGTELFPALPDDPSIYVYLEDLGACLADIQGSIFSQLGFCYEIIVQ